MGPVEVSIIDVARLRDEDGREIERLEKGTETSLSVELDVGDGIEIGEDEDEEVGLKEEVGDATVVGGVPRRC